MFNHAPEKYKCPICLAIRSIENNETMILQSDIIYRDSLLTVFIASIFNKTNPGHILVVPNNHYENLYDIPEEILSRISVVSKQFAIVLKNVRSCNGITILQNNEPAGGQHAFHYHMHIFPRFENDHFQI